MLKRIKLQPIVYGASALVGISGTLWLWGRGAALAGGLVVLGLCTALFFFARRGFAGPASRDISIDPIGLAAPIPNGMEQRLAVLENGIGVMARRVLALEGRVQEMQAQVDDSRAAVADARTGAIDAVAGELEAISSVVRDLAELVAHQETRFLSGAFARETPPVEKGPPAAVSVASAEPAAPAGLREAIASGAVELLLQPIVGLPGRKIAFYELLGRVREGDRTLSSDDVLEGAVALGLGARHGRHMLGHALRVVRHLMSRNRDVPLLCPTTLDTLADPVVFRELSTLVGAEPALAGRVLFRLSQADLRDVGPLDAEALDTLRELGFRFAMDGLVDLHFDPQRLAAIGVRLVKTPIGLLMAAAEGAVPAEIHPFDIAGLLARHGLSMVASEVGTERIALELHEFSAPFGQGAAFGESRPVRLDVIAASEAATAQSLQRVRPEPAPEPGSVQATPPVVRMPLRSMLRRTTA